MLYCIEFPSRAAIFRKNGKNLLITNLSTSSSISLPLSKPLFKNKHQLPQLRIIRGDVVTDNSEWPFMASIMYNEHHYCGGTVWNAKHILTAAHCMFFENGTSIPSSEIQVYLGHVDIATIQKSYLFSVKDLIVHEKYKKVTNGYDIGIIRLSRAIDFNDANHGVKCVCQPVTEVLDIIPDECWVLGWGETEAQTIAERLHEVKIPLRDEDYCSKTILKFNSDIQLCAGFDKGEKDACQGDSGGPLMCAITTGPYIYQQVGVVSFGKGCAKPNSPGRNFFPKMRLFCARA